MSLLTSFTRPVGGAQFDFVETFDSRLAGSASALSANFVYLAPVRVAKPVPVATLMCYVGATAAGNIGLAIYTSADGGATLAHVAHTASIAASANALNSGALTAAYTLQPFVLYYFGYCGDNATNTPLRTGTGVAAINGDKKTAISALAAGVIPLTADLAFGSNQASVVWIRAK